MCMCVYMHTCVYIYIYIYAYTVYVCIYIYIYVFIICREEGGTERDICNMDIEREGGRETKRERESERYTTRRHCKRHRQQRHEWFAAAGNHIGAKDCTPEIKTSEIIVDVQWHIPMDVQWHVPTDVNLSVVLFQRIVTCPVDVYLNCPMDCQWHVPMHVHVCDIWCVICCPSYSRQCRQKYRCLQNKRPL